MKRKFIFLLSLLLVFTSFAPIFAKDIGYGLVNSNIKKRTLKVRKKPNTKSKTLFKLTLNDSVIITSSSGKWYKIKYPLTKKKGWVKQKYITLTALFGEDDDKIKRENKKVPKLNKSASKSKKK